MREFISFMILMLASTGYLPGQEEPQPGPEDRARALLERVREAAARKRDAEAWQGLDELRGPLAETVVAKEARDEIERLRLQVGIGHVGAAAGFTGRVVKGKDGHITITYDFERPETLADFKVEEHIPDARFLERDGKEWAGTGIIAHRGLFRGDVSLRVTGVPIAAHDFGIAFFEFDVLEPRFIAAVLENTFFGINYYAEGNRTKSPGNLILWCGKGAVSRARENPSQLFAESRTPTFERNKEATFGLTWSGSGVVFDTSGEPMKANFNPKTQSFDRRGVGIHLHRSRFRPVSITIEGTLDPR